MYPLILWVINKNSSQIYIELDRRREVNTTRGQCLNGTGDDKLTMRSGNPFHRETTRMLNWLRALSSLTGRFFNYERVSLHGGICCRYPTDGNTYDIDRQFLWGDALLITPVLTKVGVPRVWKQRVLLQGSTLAVFCYPEHPRFSDGIPDSPAQQSGRITKFCHALGPRF